MKTTDDNNVITGVFGKSGSSKQSRLNMAAEPRWVDFNKDGEADAKSVANVRAFLKHIGVKLWLDQFANRIRIGGRAEKDQYLNNHVLSSLWGQANELGFKPSKAFMRDALLSIAVDNGRHPLQDF